MKKFKWTEQKIEDNIKYNAWYGKELLGILEYYKPWKKWVWEQGLDIIMSLSCQIEVVKKTAELEGIKIELNGVGE